MNERAASHLEPLRSAREALATLQLEEPEPEAARAAMLQVIGAIETALRRVLRDDPDAPLPLRLRALAPDELSAEELVAELRQRDRIGIELAAAFHELLGLRRGLLEGSPGTTRDRQRVLRVAERLERGVRPPAPSSPPPAPAHPPDAPEIPSHHAAAAERERDPRAVPPWIWAAAAAGLLLVVLLGFWLRLGMGGQESALQEGIALFRSGELARAAPIFRRHAEANPRDPTPRLYLARIYRRTDEPDSAAAELRRALDVAPEDAGVYRELGLLFLDLEQPEAAIRPFRRAVELDPEQSEGWIMLIQALQHAGQAGAAQRVLAQAPAEVRALLQQRPTDAAPRAAPPP